MTDDSADQPGALAGIRVLDLAGPSAVFGTKLLADLGADVIKVEPPGGDVMRTRGPFAHNRPGPEASLPFFINNSNKRGVTLNLQTRAGRTLFAKLAATADVVFETARPGWMDGNGVGNAALSALNPRLVYTAVTPYGQSGPRAQWKGTEISGQAMGGAMFLTGETRGRPVRGGINVADKMAGYTAATATVFALYYRTQSGKGQFIDVSVQEAVAAQMESAAVGYAFEGRILEREGRRYPRTTCPAAIFPCSDGWASIVASPVHQWQALVAWIGDERLADERYLDVTIRFAERDSIDPIIAGWTKSIPKSQLFHEGQRRGVPVGECLTPLDVVRDIHLLQRGYVVDADHPVLGPLKMPGPPFLMTGTPWRLRRSAPTLGEHNVEVFGELGVSRAEIAELHGRGVV